MSCTKLQLPPEPLTRGYRPQIPVLSFPCPQLNLLKPPPPPNKIPGYATGLPCTYCEDIYKFPAGLYAVHS